MIRIVYLLSLLLIISCQSNLKKERIDNPIDSVITWPKKDSLNKQPEITPDAILESEELIEDSVELDKGYMYEELKPVRENFKRINAITKWTSVEKKELWETTEGGESHFYYMNDTLEKIHIRQFGEMFQCLIECYLIDNQLSFVLEKSYEYNRPMYYDSTMMKENNDTEAFDFDLSEIIEDRSYFVHGKLIHQTNNQDCGAPMAEDYLANEQIRLLKMYEGFLE